MTDEAKPVPKDLLAEVKRYFAYLKRVFRLDQWEIEVDPKLSAHDGLYAQVTYVSQIRSGILRLGEDFPKLSRKDKTDTLIHEVLHIVLGPMDGPYKAAVAALQDVQGEDLVTTPASRMLSVQFNEATEHVVDHLAHCLTPILKPFGFQEVLTLSN